MQIQNAKFQSKQHIVCLTLNFSTSTVIKFAKISSELKDKLEAKYLAGQFSMTTKYLIKR